MPLSAPQNVLQSSDNHDEETFSDLDNPQTELPQWRVAIQEFFSHQHPAFILVMLSISILGVSLIMVGVTTVVEGKKGENNRDRSVHFASATPEVTTTPSPTASPSASPSTSPQPSPSVTPSATPKTTPKITPTPSPTPTSSPTSQLIQKKVLTVGFNPTENGTTYADAYFKYGMGGRTAAQTEDYVFQDTVAAFKRLSKDNIQFSIVKKINITESPTYPDGFQYTLTSYKNCVWGTPDFKPDECEARKLQFDYVAWMEKHRICQIAEEAGADEIWMLSLPYMMAWENFMVGPTRGFDVNGANYVVPSCHKHFIVVNGTYDRPTNVLHNIGHRVEATMMYLTTSWKLEDQSKHWLKFSGMGGEVPDSCGNTHFPHNARQGYDYGNTTTKASSCVDWKNFPNYTGAKTEINCSTWNCHDQGWQEYWLSYIPSGSGTVTMTSLSGKTFEFPKNWWTLLLSPGAAIEMKQKMQ